MEHPCRQIGTCKCDYLQTVVFMLPLQGAYQVLVNQKALPFVKIGCPFRAPTKMMMKQNADNKINPVEFATQLFHRVNKNINK